MNVVGINKIQFETKLYNIGQWTILRLPKNASAKLTSRGLAMVAGTINGFPFQSALEPDGNDSHWFRVDKSMQKSVGIKSGDVVYLEIEQISEWSEPKIPTDIKTGISESKKALNVWNDITPLARWEWIRWISATKNPQTRLKRIDVALSKLNAGKRRPCCFNTRQCSVPDVSNSGILIDPS